MSNTTAIAYDILARDRGASTTLNRLGDAAESTGRRTQRAGQLVRAGAKVMAVGIGTATLVAMRFAKAAASDEVGATKMARAFRNNASATRVQIAATEAWITKQGLALGVTDDELRPALGRLVTATHDVKDAQNLASLAMDVSAGRGKSLQAVSEALAKGADGNTTALGKLGVKTKDAAGKALTFDQITQNLAKTFKGQASAAADTTSGKYDRVKLAFSEAGEALGYKLMGPLTDMATWLAGTGVPRLISFSDTLTDKVGAATDTVRDKVRLVLRAFDGLKTMDGAAIGHNVAAAIGSGLDQIGSLSGTLLSKLDNAFSGIDWIGLGITLGKETPALLIGLATGILNLDLGGLLSGLGDHWFAVLMGILSLAFAPAKWVGKLAMLLERIPLAGSMLSWMVRGINGVGGRFKGFGSELIGWFVSGFRSALGRSGPGMVSRLWSLLMQLPARAAGIRGVLASKLGDALRGAALSAGEALAGGVTRIVGVIGKLPGKMLGKLGDLSGLLVSTGVDVARGMAVGIAKGAKAVLDAAGALAGKVKDKIAGALHIKSPSRVMMTIGGYVTEGLALGMIGPKSRKLDAAIKKTVDRVSSIKDKLAGLTSSRDQFASGMNWGTSVFAGDYGAFGPSVGGMLALAQGELGKATQVQGDVSKLLGMGLSKSLIEQMQANGPSGMAALHALAGANSGQIGQLNAIDAATQAAYGAAGRGAADPLYGAVIKQTENDLKGAEKLLKVMERLDKSIKDKDTTIIIKLEGKDIAYSLNKHNKNKGMK